MTAARSLGKLFSILLVVAVVSVVGIGAAAYLKITNNVQAVDIGNGQDEEAPSFPTLQGGANILIVGSDDRTGQGEEFGEGTDEASGVLNDVNMVVHIAEDHSSATVVSIPRDTIVNTPSCTSDDGVAIDEQYGVPFNSILGEGGLSCIVAAAEQLSGLDIQYAGLVKFRGVIELSNAIGGVKVCVANDIDDPYVGLNLTAGEHTIQGEDALKFLRTRHGVGDGSDLSRIANQQLFLSALLQQVKSSDTLTNPAKLYGLAVAVTNNMVLSNSLNNLDTLMAMAGAISKIPLEQIVFAQLPVASSSYEGKVEPLEPDADTMWASLRNDQPLNVVGPTSTVEATDPSGGTTDGTDTSTDETGGDGTTDGTGATEVATPQPTLVGQEASQTGCANA